MKFLFILGVISFLILLMVWTMLVIAKQADEIIEQSYQKK